MPVHVNVSIRWHKVQNTQELIKRVAGDGEGRISADNLDQS